MNAIRAALLIPVVLFAALPGCSTTTVGDPLPSLEVFRHVEGTPGGPLTAETHRGRPVMLVFFATTCGPCDQEMEHIQEISERCLATDLLLIAVSPEDEETLRTYVNERGFTFSVASDPGSIELSDFGVPGWPTTLLADRDGIIREYGAAGEGLGALEPKPRADMPDPASAPLPDLVKSGVRFLVLDRMQMASPDDQRAVFDNADLRRFAAYWKDPMRRRAREGLIVRETILKHPITPADEWVFEEAVIEGSDGDDPAHPEVPPSFLIGGEWLTKTTIDAWIDKNVRRAVIAERLLARETVTSEEIEKLVDDVYFSLREEVERLIAAHAAH